MAQLHPYGQKLAALARESAPCILEWFAASTPGRSFTPTQWTCHNAVALLQSRRVAPRHLAPRVAPLQSRRVAPMATEHGCHVIPAESLHGQWTLTHLGNQCWEPIIHHTHSKLTENGKRNRTQQATKPPHHTREREGATQIDDHCLTTTKSI